MGGRTDSKRKGEKPNRLVKYVFGCRGADYPLLRKTADANRTEKREVGGGGSYLAQSRSSLHFQDVEQQQVALEYVVVISR